jgi:membrane protein implicated in regulation of membrane protease activity
MIHRILLLAMIFLLLAALTLAGSGVMLLFEAAKHRGGLGDVGAQVIGVVFIVVAVVFGVAGTFGIRTVIRRLGRDSESPGNNSPKA